MKYFLLLALALVACSGDEQQDSAELASRKLECRRLEAHIFRITPQLTAQFAGMSEIDAQKRADELAAKLPAEDIDQCAAGEPEVTACMATARDLASLKACIPSAKVLACLQGAKQDAVTRKACFTAPRETD